MTVLIFILVLAVLVIVHEFGHFIVAKLAGIRVDEFGFGFPPKLFSFKSGETIYSINLIPFGGFVKIYGEQVTKEALAGPDVSRSFIKKNRLIQAAVLSAGVFFNFLLAWFILAICFLIGLVLPTDGYENFESFFKNRETIMINVLKDSPAERSGLEPGDKIIAVSSGQEILSSLKPESVGDFISSRSGDAVNILVKRVDKELSFSVVPEMRVDLQKSVLGVSMVEIGTLSLPVFDSVKESFFLASNLAKETVLGFKEFLQGLFVGTNTLADLTGPVGIAGLVGEARDFGFVYLLSFAAFISINLAVLNLLPFPALDGGRLLFVFLEAIFRRSIPAQVVNTLNAVGFILLITLMFVVTYQDILKLF